VRYINDVDAKHPERHVSVLADSITNWQHETVGVFCHIQDLDYLYRVFDAIQLLVSEWKDTDSVIRNTLHATEQLGHKWGRLYIVSEDDPDCFVSTDCFGIEDTRLQRAFKSRKISLPSRRQPGHEAWVCIDQDKPLVFGCDPNLKDRELFFSTKGLEVVNVRESHCPRRLEKNPGDMWIDFPLIAGRQVLGKITLECNDDYRPEDFAFLVILCVLTKRLLEASIRWEERMSWIHEASERAIADTSHHIATSLASLPVLLARYRRLERNLKELASLNKDFEHLSAWPK